MDESLKYNLVTNLSSLVSDVEEKEKNNKQYIGVLTILGDKKIISSKNKIFKLEKELVIKKEKDQNLREELVIIKNNLFELEIIELKLLHDELKTIKINLSSNKLHKQPSSKQELREYISFKENVQNKELLIKNLKKEKEKIESDIKVNNFKIIKLEDNVNKLNKYADEVNKVWKKPNEHKRRERVADALELEKDKSTINQQQPTTSGTQSSTSKDNDKSTKLE